VVSRRTSGAHRGGRHRADARPGHPPARRGHRPEVEARDRQRRDASCTSSRRARWWSRWRPMRRPAAAAAPAAAAEPEVIRRASLRGLKKRSSDDRRRLGIRAPLPGDAAQHRVRRGRRGGAAPSGGFEDGRGGHADRPVRPRARFGAGGQALTMMNLSGGAVAPSRVSTRSTRRPSWWGRRRELPLGRLRLRRGARRGHNGFSSRSSSAWARRSSAGASGRRTAATRGATSRITCWRGSMTTRRDRGGSSDCRAPTRWRRSSRRASRRP